MLKELNYPTVSIIMPVRNEERYIGECLERLVNQSYPKDRTEILVVDGMSADKTREIVEKFKVQSSKNEIPAIRLLDNLKGHRASALNIGIREAKGDVIVRIDARTIIPPDYIEKCVKTLIETGADNVGGMQKPIAMLNVGDCKLEGKNNHPQPPSLNQIAIGLALSHPFGIGDAQFRLGRKSGYVDTVYLGCFRRGIFDEVGLFDEESAVMSEDADINYRIRKTGGKVYFNKDIAAYYYPRADLKNLWKLYFRYGGAKGGFFLKHKVLKLRQWIPIIFILSLISLGVLSFFKPLFLWILGIISSIYLLTDFFVSLYLSLKDKKPLLFSRLVGVFPCLHFAWGLGFLKRIIQGPRHKKYWSY